MAEIINALTNLWNSTTPNELANQTVLVLRDTLAITLLSSALLDIIRLISEASAKGIKLVWSKIKPFKVESLAVDSY